MWGSCGTVTIVMYLNIICRNYVYVSLQFETLRHEVLCVHALDFWYPLLFSVTSDEVNIAVICDDDCNVSHTFGIIIGIQGRSSTGAVMANMSDILLFSSLHMHSGTYLLHASCFFVQEVSRPQLYTMDHWKNIQISNHQINALIIPPPELVQAAEVDRDRYILGWEKDRIHQDAIPSFLEVQRCAQKNLRLLDWQPHELGYIVSSALLSISKGVV